MEPINFIVTGVGGQGSILASDVVAAVGLAAGYDVRKSDIKGVAMRGGAVVAHIRWGERVYSPLVPPGGLDYLLAFEILEGLRWLDQMRPQGTVLINQQQIHPVSVSSGSEAYPAPGTVETALRAAVKHVYRVPGLEIAQALGNARVLNVVLVGALSGLLPVDEEVWVGEVKGRVPSRFLDLNLRAFQKGREWLTRERAG